MKENLYKVGLGVLFVALIISFGTRSIGRECPKVTAEPYTQNQMVDGCVMQKSGGVWIKTCG
jgi:hypothetical protein